MDSDTNPYEDIFTILESLDHHDQSFQFQTEIPTKKQKLETQNKASHITVERNRRKQMNQNLALLRSLMPCFYVKRGDQASIIGGVINYINELQEVLQSLESKKQRKVYSDVLNRRIVSSPRVQPPPQLSPRKPPLSPRTPQSGIQYGNRVHGGYGVNSPSLPSPVDLSPCNSSTSSVNDGVNELAASSRSAVAEVEVKFSGSDILVVRTASNRVQPGQVVKIVSALEEIAFEVLQVNVNSVEGKILYSFTIKIGIDCQLSAQELAEKIQKTFSNF